MECSRDINPDARSRSKTIVHLIGRKYTTITIKTVFFY